MANYKTINQLSPTDAAYIAGIIDGEGTITLTQEHSNEQRRLVVSISSTERRLLEYIQRITSIGTISNKRTYKNNHTPSYCYKVTNRQALSLIEQIYVYLRGYKAKRAQLVLDKYLALTPRNGRYTAELLAQRQAFEEKLLNTLPNIHPISKRS